MAATDSSSSLKALGNYDLLQEVGSGAMGTVYKGRHRDTQEIVAVKLMAPEVAKNTTYLKRFEQEFRVASRLDHPNIVRGLDYDDTGATPYLVMEFVEGESLGDRLSRTGKLPEAEAVNIITQIAEGLHAAHEQGLIHRDVKPDNILVTPDGKAKITDLGLVKETDTGTQLTRPGIGLGTPNFMAPEQFKNAKNASVRCDVYSLAATLYQVVTGVLPFQSKDVVGSMMLKMKNDLPLARKVVPELSERLSTAIRRALDADANKRPASCREFIQDLTSEGGAARAGASGPSSAGETSSAASKPASTPEASDASAAPPEEKSVEGLPLVLVLVIAAGLVIGTIYLVLR